MGQRLTIVVQNDGKNLACAYYHWGAYTKEAIRLTSLAVNAYNNRWPGTDAIHTALGMLIATGAGIDSGHGIILDKPQAIKSCLMLCQSSVIIDIGKEKIWFNVYDEYSKKDFILGHRQEEFDALSTTFYTDILDITVIPISCFDKLREFVNSHPAGVVIDDGFFPFVYKWI